MAEEGPMNPIARSSFLLVGLTAFVVHPEARADELDPAIASLVEAERGFARAAVEHGVREAFLANLADDAVLFRPRPVPGRAWTAARPSPPFVLNWEPVFVEVARSGDLGYTTGPYELREKGAEAPDTGHFVSVWRRAGAGGPWKVVLDLGNAHFRPGTKPREVKGRMASTRGSGAAIGRDAALVALRAAEGRYSELAAAEGVGKAIATHGAKDVRLYRMDELPAIGREAAIALAAREGARARSKPAAVAVAESADLGYAYGVGERLGGDGKPDGELTFARIWRREGDAWRVALEIELPLPPAAPPPREARP
jgi:ketosteroid isomerase-like protein